MEAEAIIGFAIAGVALCLLISFGLWSRRTINRISRNKTGNLREIKNSNGR
jgi:hypothetical protein